MLETDTPKPRGRQSIVDSGIDMFRHVMAVSFELPSLSILCLLS